MAVEGAELLKASGLGALPLMFGFVLTAAFLNLFMGSASAKWAACAWRPRCEAPPRSAHGAGGGVTSRVRSRRVD